VTLTTLKTRAEFVRARGGPRWSTAAFALEACAQPDGINEPARFGFTVSKRIGGAVVRNRVRRRLRALVATLAPGRTRHGWDYVLIARPGAVRRSYQDLRLDLEQALDRVNRPQAAMRRSRKPT
jgi:ribonuclease P protein component